MNSDNYFSMTQQEYSNAFTLYTMFRHFEWNTVVKVLKSCDNNLEAAIDKLLDTPPEKSLYDSEIAAQTESASSLQANQNSQIETQDQRVSALEEKVKELEAAKARTEEEKKNAMRWCVSQMDEMKQLIHQKEEVIAKQSQEIKERDASLQLRESMNRHLVSVAKQLQEQVESFQQRQQRGFVQPKQSRSTSTPEDNPLQQALEWGKDFVCTVGDQLVSLESGLRTEFKKLEKEIMSDDKGWVIVDKVKDFAHTVKEELSYVFEKSGNSNSNSSSPPPPPVSANSLWAVYETMNSDEERRAWIANVQEYIQQLEGSVKRYEELFQ